VALNSGRKEVNTAAGMAKWEIRGRKERGRNGENKNNARREKLRKWDRTNREQKRSKHTHINLITHL
jgi:hypothetical protein